MLVKVCGNRANIKDVATLPIDMLGLIFWPASPRCVIGKVKPQDVKNITDKKKIGVFVDLSKEKLVKFISEYDLDGVQLHGDESLEYVKELRSALPDKMIIKAFRIGEHLDLEHINSFSESVDLFLFDKESKSLGGSGESFSWELLYGKNFLKPFILAGGIGPHSNLELKMLCEMQSQLCAIDLNSKFEISPGVKDIRAIKEFLMELRDDA